MTGTVIIITSIIKIMHTYIPSIANYVKRQLQKTREKKYDDCTLVALTNLILAF